MVRLDNYQDFELRKGSILRETLSQMELLQKYLNDLYPMSQGLEDRILDALEFKKLPKKEFFLREGETNTHIYFLLSGLVRIYHHTLDDKEVTTWLLKEGNVFISVYSFFKQKPSFENIVALEDCVAVGFSFKKLEEICQTHSEFNKYQIAILRKYYANSEEMKFRLARQKPLQRYKMLVDEESELLQRVPLHILAGYLNISESSLKRARSDYMEAKRLKG